MPRSFSVTFDYRCPFARNAHEHVLAGLAGGADWDVSFAPLSLMQLHVEEGQPPVWDDPTADTGLWALQAGIYVRDELPDRFLEVHRALFAIRHDQAQRLDGPAITATLADLLGQDVADGIAEAVESGRLVEQARKEHEAVTTGPGAWGVPTFITSDAGAGVGAPTQERAVFVRLMDRNPGETEEQRAHGRATIERVLDLLEWTDLNEFKATRLPR
jgi:hypothetical protein